MLRDVENKPMKPGITLPTVRLSRTMSEAMESVGTAVPPLHFCSNLVQCASLDRLEAPRLLTKPHSWKFRDDGCTVDIDG